MNRWGPYRLCITSSDMIKRTEHSCTVISDLRGAPSIPVIRIFLRMCRGVSPLSNDIDAAAVWDSFCVAVRLLVKGNDFLVILLEENTKVNFKFRICMVGIYAALLHLTSRIFCRRLRLSMSCGVCPTASLLFSLLLRLVVLGLCAFLTLKTRNLKINTDFTYRLFKDASNDYLRVTGVLGGSVLRIRFSRTRADKSSVRSI